MSARRPSLPRQPVPTGRLPSLGALSLNPKRGAPVAAEGDDDASMGDADDGASSYGGSTSGGGDKRPPSTTPEELQREMEDIAAEERSLAERRANIAAARNSADAAGQKVENKKRKANTADKAAKAAAAEAKAETKKLEDQLKADKNARTALEQIQKLFEELKGYEARDRATLKQQEALREKYLRQEKIVRKAALQSGDADTIETAREAEMARKKELVERAQALLARRNARRLITTHVTRLKRVRDLQKQETAALAAAAKRKIEEGKKSAVAAAKADRKLKIAQADQAALKKLEEQECIDALNEMHKLRERLKWMAKKWDKLTKTVEEKCDPKDGFVLPEGQEKAQLDDLVEPWVLEMYQKLDELHEWIANREEADPDAWDLAEHAEVVKAGGAQFVDSDAEETVEDLPDDRQVGDPGSGGWYSGGASKPEDTEGGGLFDDLDEEMREGGYEGDTAEAVVDQYMDEDSTLYQIDYLLKTVDKNPTKMQMDLACKDIKAGVLKWLNEWSYTTNMGFNEHNIAVYGLKGGDIIVTVMLPEKVIEAGKNVPYGENTPKDVIVTNMDNFPLLLLDGDDDGGDRDHGHPDGDAHHRRRRAGVDDQELPALEGTHRSQPAARHHRQGAGGRRD